MSTSSSTTGVGSTGHCRNARVVSPPPQGLSRGKVARSASSTETPAEARWYAVADPAGPPPTTSTSKRFMGLRLQCAALKGVCPSGQRERAVNPSAQPTEVRILPPPLFASPVTQTAWLREHEIAIWAISATRCRPWCCAGRVGDAQRRRLRSCRLPSTRRGRLGLAELCRGTGSTSTPRTWPDDTVQSHQAGNPKSTRNRNVGDRGFSARMDACAVAGVDPRPRPARRGHHHATQHQVDNEGHLDGRDRPGPVRRFTGLRGCAGVYAHKPPPFGGLRRTWVAAYRSRPVSP